MLQFFAKTDEWRGVGSIKGNRFNQSTSYPPKQGKAPAIPGGD